METDKPKNKGGRPEGALSKLSREAREAAKLTGLLPHEILLSMARGQPQATYEVDEEGEIKLKGMVSVDLDKRMDAAKAAAPYYAPKISTVELISGASDHDLDQLIKELAAQAGVSIGDGGGKPQEQAQDGAGKRRRVQILE